MKYNWKQKEGRVKSIEIWRGRADEKALWAKRKDVNTRKSSYWRAVEPAQGTAQPEQGLESNAGDNVDAEMAQILDDVEQLFGEPVFLTLRNRAAARSFW